MSSALLNRQLIMQTEILYDLYILSFSYFLLNMGNLPVSSQCVSGVISDFQCKPQLVITRQDLASGQNWNLKNYSTINLVCSTDIMTSLLLFHCQHCCFLCEQRLLIKEYCSKRPSAEVSKSRYFSSVESFLFFFFVFCLSCFCSLCESYS